MRPSSVNREVMNKTCVGPFLAVDKEWSEEKDNVCRESDACESDIRIWKGMILALRLGAALDRYRQFTHIHNTSNRPSYSSRLRWWLPGKARLLA